MLCLPDAWIWDSWVVDDGERFICSSSRPREHWSIRDGDTKTPHHRSRDV